jgi:hypothetical protein
MACLSFHYKIRFAFWACLPSKNTLLEGRRNFTFRSSHLLLRLPTRQLQTSPGLPAAQAADSRRQSGIGTEGASFVVLNIPWNIPTILYKIVDFAGDPVLYSTLEKLVRPYITESEVVLGRFRKNRDPSDSDSLSLWEEIRLNSDEYQIKY